MLRERTRVIVPDRLDITGGALATSGSVIAWSGVTRDVRLWSGRKPKPVCREFRPVVTAGAYVSDHFELVDSQRRRVLRVHADASCDVAFQSTMRRVSSAAFSDSLGWFLTGVDDSGTSGTFVLCCSDDGYGSFARVGEEGKALLRQPGSASKGITSTELHWPFRWTTRGLGPSDSVAAQPFQVDTVISSSRNLIRASELLALPTLDIERGFLQELVDTRSDLRVLVLYDRRGTRVRVTELDGALGFLSVDRLTHGILALQTTDRRELIVYDWRWIEYD